jgi:hypothetical protein
MLPSTLSSSGSTSRSTPPVPGRSGSPKPSISLSERLDTSRDWKVRDFFHIVIALPETKSLLNADCRTVRAFPSMPKPPRIFERFQCGLSQTRRPVESCPRGCFVFCHDGKPGLSLGGKLQSGLRIASFACPQGGLSATISQKVERIGMTTNWESLSFSRDVLPPQVAATLGSPSE